MCIIDVSSLGFSSSVPSSNSKKSSLATYSASLLSVICIFLANSGAKLAGVLALDSNYQISKHLCVYMQLIILNHAWPDRVSIDGFKAFDDLSYVMSTRLGGCSWCAIRQTARNATC